MNTVFLILIAVIGGLAVTTQGQFMGLIDKTVGTKESVFLTYTGGGLFAALPILFTKGGNLEALRQVPAYAYASSGLLGLVIVGSIGYTVPRLGLSKALFIVVGSQLLAAAILEHFGTFGSVPQPFSVTKVLGMVCMVTGVWLAFR